MHIVAIIQARMGSTRLPGKVLMDLAGEPMLVRVINRCRRATALDDIVIATTTKDEDDAIEELCLERSCLFFRGEENDVLDRYYRAARENQADVIVRITSDCPLIEPEVIDCVVNEFTGGQPEVDYTSNNLPRRTFPLGLDTEAFRFNVLEQVWLKDKDSTAREHVTPYIHRNPALFNTMCITNNVDYSHMRWTVDEPDDLEFVRQVYNYFDDDSFSWREVLAVLKEHPELLDINKHVRQKTI
jgi:spore coat polysaccharide biosynthesis protein SpsF